MKKSASKIIVPLFAVAMIALIYFSYFYKSDTLGKFSGFDTNNNANKEIRVEVISDKPINWDMTQGACTFFARDADGMEVTVSAPFETSKALEMAKRVTMRGHLHKDHFHAVEVVIK